MTLEGKSVVLLGRFKTMRSQLITAIDVAGGTVHKNVSSRIDFVVCGKVMGKQHALARRLGILEISEDQLLALLRGEALEESSQGKSSIGEHEPPHNIPSPEITEHIFSTILKGRLLDGIGHVELGKFARPEGIDELILKCRPDITWN